MGGKKQKIGVALDEEMVERLDKIVEKLDHMNTSRSEAINSILAAFFQGNMDHVEMVSKFTTKKRKGKL